MKIRLYHGTSRSNVKRILMEGVENLYLTLDREQAEYYAECASEDDGSEPIVCVVEACIDRLVADLASYEEPITFVLKKNGYSSERDWHANILEGHLSVPSIEDWKSSLKLTGCVKLTGHVKPSDFVAIDEYLCPEDEDAVMMLLSDPAPAPRVSPGA